MAGLSNSIEEFIKRMIQESTDGILEIGRNELAQHFHCAPSQINYVLTTRFTSYKGYYIESKRGGSGYIKIIKLPFDQTKSFESLAKDTIGDTITKDKAYRIIHALLEEKAITKREAQIMTHALDDVSLTNVPIDYRNKVRADILRNMIFAYFR